MEDIFVKYLSEIAPVKNHTINGNGNRMAASMYAVFNNIRPIMVAMDRIRATRIRPNAAGHILAPVSNSGTHDMHRLYVNTKFANTKYVNPENE